MEPVDAQVTKKGQLVLRLGAPGALWFQWSDGSGRVSLIHRDQPHGVGVQSELVDRHSLPQRRGVNSDPYFTRPRLRFGKIYDLENLSTAKLFEPDCFHRATARLASR
jgi:hypothetical protein